MYVMCKKDRKKDRSFLARRVFWSFLWSFYGVFFVRAFLTPEIRFFFSRCLLQVYKDVIEKLGPLNFFFQAVEAEHHAKTGDRVTADDMDSKGIKLTEAAARLLDFETMGFLAFSVDLFDILNIYATKWQCHDLEMCDLLDGVLVRFWKTERTKRTKNELFSYYVCYPALQASKPRFFFPRCLLQVYKDVCDKLGPLNFFFQDVEADHHAKTGDAVTAHDMDTNGINLVEVAARLLDFETMGFLAFSVNLFHILDIYATRWQCHDLEMCDLLDGVTRVITKKWRTLTPRR